MSRSLVCVILLCVALAWAQNDCDLDGPYTCTGGQIIGMKFGRTLDSNYFQYYVTQGDSCTLVQDGEWDSHSSSATIDISLDGGDSCKITGSSPSQCSCRSSFQLTASNNCQQLSGPNGEVCTPSNTCDDNFSCTNGATPVPKPNYTPTANGCGPSAFPLAGPSFSFLECCNQHDYCYGTCGKTKSECDANFYACTYCSCQTAYDNFIEREACEEVACAYFQAVDDFGCYSYTEGQKGACSCSGSKSNLHGATLKTVNKLGPVHPTMRQTELFCSTPFDPTCPDQPNQSPVSSKNVSPVSPVSPVGVSPVSPVSPIGVSPVSPVSPIGVSPLTVSRSPVDLSPVNNSPLGLTVSRGNSPDSGSSALVAFIALVAAVQLIAM